MVTGRLEGAALARRYNLEALFIDREGENLLETRIGPLFAGASESGPTAKVQTP